jgi:hypothetical protein
MRPTTRVLCLFAALSACIPAHARAETYVSPWAGVVFGNDRAASGIRSFGVSFGSAGAEFGGSETTIGFTQKFFGSKPENYVLDIMTGITLGPSFSGMYSDVRARPYFGVAIGTIRTSINSGVSGVSRSARNDLGFNVGAGAMIDFTTRFGLRADVRYYRTFNGSTKENSLNVDLAHFHFWQASIGLVIWRG